MTPIEKLEQFALRLHTAGLDVAHIDLVAIIAELHGQPPEAAGEAFRAVQTVLDEVRPGWNAAHQPAAANAVVAIRSMAERADRSRQDETGVRAAWGAVVDTLYAVRADWDETAGKSSLENAVATIRSMAAQCSAQPTPDYARPMGVPAIRREQIDALVFANGFMYAKGHEPIADQLAALVGWLRTNAPQE